MRINMRLIGKAACAALVVVTLGSPALGQSRNDKKSEAQIRAALANWVDATNRRDATDAQSIWAQDVVGWFPKAAEFSNTAAFVLAGVPEQKGASYSTYELKIDEVAVSGSLAAVHDVWTETKHFSGSPVTVMRIIRGSELWRRQRDGKWRIVRWVSAPEKWEKVG